MSNLPQNDWEYMEDLHAARQQGARKAIHPPASGWMAIAEDLQAERDAALVRVAELERALERSRPVIDAAREAIDVADRMGDDLRADTIAMHTLRDRLADLDRES